MDFKLTHKFYILVKSLIWIFYAFYLTYFFSDVNDSEIVISVLLCAVLIQMTIISFVDNWYRKKRPTLLDWFRLTTFFILIVNFLSLVQNLNHQNNFNGYILKSEFILLSLFTILTGLIALKFSELLYTYLYVQPRSTNGHKKHNEYDFRNLSFFYLLSLILGLVEIFLMITGQVGYGTFQENTTSDYSFLFQIVFILSGFFLSLFAIFKYLYAFKNKKFDVAYLIFFVIQLIYGFLSGMKETIIVPIIIVLIPYLLSGRKLPKKVIYLGILGVLLIYPLNDNYREVLNNFPNLKKNEALGIAAVKTMDISFTENLSQGGDSFSSRLSLFPYLVYCVEKEGEWTYYKHLDRYIYLPIAWIVPRVLIPDKPKSETGAVLNYQIFGYETNSLTGTTYGWAYLEGGLLYVFVLFLLFGFFILYFQNNLGYDSLFGLLAYVGLLTDLLKVESDIYFLISGILQRMLIYFLFYKILITKTKKAKKTYVL